MFGFPLSHHILYYLLNFCNSFHEFNFEIENFLKVNDETENGTFEMAVFLSKVPPHKQQLVCFSSTEVKCSLTSEQLKG